MSEMKLIEDMCAAVPAPDEARLAAVRARVLDEARQMTRPGRSVRRRGRVRVLTWPRLAVTGAAAAAAAVTLTVAGVIPFGSALAPPASAAVLLHRAAAAALAQAVPTAKQLIYSDTAIYYATFTHHGSGKPDGHVRVRQQEWQSPASPTAFYRTSPCDVDGDLQRGLATCSFQGGSAPDAKPYSTYAGLRALPVSASQLLAYLATLPAPGGHGRYDREWSGANMIASLNPVLPPRFGAALFWAVAQIPGVILLPSTTDAAGAHGMGITRPAAGMRAELIFDPGTYRLVGQQYTVLGQGHGHRADYVASATALIQARFISTGPGSSAGSSGSITAPRDGQFVYTDTEIAWLYPASSQARRVPRFTLRKGAELMWQSVDGSKPGAVAMAPCQAGGATCLLLIPPGPETPAFTTYAGLRQLPGTPGALSSYLQQHNACPSSIRAGRQSIQVGSSTREWNAVTAILGNNMVMPPGLGKALFETAAKIPGTAVLRGITDAAGGHGIAVARDETPRLRTELIFAPRSYRFIGVQDVLTRGAPGVPAGTVWAASSLVDAKIVNSAPVTSPGQSYTPQTCGFTPGFYAVGSSASGSSASSGTGPAGS